MLQRPPSRIRGQHGARTLELRPPSPMDAPSLIEAIDESLPELKVFMPFAHLGPTIEQQYDRLVGVQQDYWAEGDKVFHIWEGERLVACAGLHRRTLNRLGFEVGFWVRSSVAGQGIGTFATRTLTQLCFDHLGCERVQLLHNSANEASRLIAMRCGFKVEGQLRRFETAPSQEMIANGATDETLTVVNALVRDDLNELPWFCAHRQHIEVFDWRGELVTSLGD